MYYAPTLGLMTKVGLPFPEVLLVASGIIEIAAALAIIAGWKTRWAAAALVLWMIPVTLVFHNPGGGQEQMAHFMKNVAIAGGLILLWALGPGALSLKRSGLGERSRSSPAGKDPGCAPAHAELPAIFDREQHATDHWRISAGD